MVKRQRNLVNKLFPEVKIKMSNLDQKPVKNPHPKYDQRKLRYKNKKRHNKALKFQPPFKKSLIGIAGKGVHNNILAKQLNATLDEIKNGWKYKTFIVLYPYPLRKARIIKDLNDRYPRTKIYLWWIGSDVWHITKDPYTIRSQTSKTRRQRYIDCIKKLKVRHLVVSEKCKNELATVGINAEVLTLVPDVTKIGKLPLPEKYTVAVYMPSRKTEFYHWRDIKNIARLCPDVKFIVYGNKRTIPTSGIKNIELRGWVKDTRKIFQDCNCLLRLLDHDGYSKSVIEAVCHDRYVISNQPYPKLCHLQSVRMIARKINTHPKLEPDVIVYYKNNYSFDKTKTKFGVK